MKKFIATLASAITMSSAIASPYNLEQLVSGKVVTVEPLTQTTYHRVPQQSCNVTTFDGRYIEQCRTYQDRIYTQRVVGYKVQFEYNGGIHNVVLKNDPGSHVRIRLVTQFYVLE
jgi:uncharacterized protein YcfJ